MSVYVIFDTDPEPDQIATITGWGDICRWTANLDPKHYANIIHLTTYGWEDELYEVERQFLRALRKYPPPDSLRTTVMGIVQKLQNRGEATTMVINDGLVPDDGVYDTPSD